jgi:hypothetical protein
MRAERRIGQLWEAQKAVVGANKGGGGRDSTGVRKTPVDEKPSLKDAGIDKNLAKQARALAKLPNLPTGRHPAPVFRLAPRTANKGPT